MSPDQEQQRRDMFDDRYRKAERREKGPKREKALRTFQRAALSTRRAKREANGLVIAAYLSVRRDARIVQLHLPGMPPVEMPTRGVCDGFSEDAQKRLLNVLHSIRRDAELPVMVTLTFPAEIAVTPAEAKACRLAWEKRMDRTKGRFWCNIWRLEAHPEMSRRLGRVHPHFHLLTWGAFYDFAEVSRTWTEVVWSVLKIDPSLCDDSGELVRAKHERAGTSCERIHKWAGVVYCAKTYLAKAEEFPVGEAGRVWGYHNRDELPIAPLERIDLTTLEAVAVRKEVERWMAEQKIVSEHLVCTIYQDDPSSFVKRLLGAVPRLCGPKIGENFR